jgi:predicted PhzF superfamily epimerase YddE/YHI9
MRLPLIHVDAFPERPFAGNPAAVCLLDGPREPGWMQALAAELNLPETAFVAAHADGFGLRWFTPTIEVDLCGHATLAAAHALWQERRLAPDAVARFHTRSGLTDDARFDFVSRFFAPAAGISEDPVTGSAHCCLGPFWAARLGKTELTGYQASPRGGTVRVRLAGDRVVLAGRAVTVFRGGLTA